MVTPLLVRCAHSVDGKLGDRSFFLFAPGVGRKPLKARLQTLPAKGMHAVRLNPRHDALMFSILSLSLPRESQKSSSCAQSGSEHGLAPALFYSLPCAKPWPRSKCFFGSLLSFFLRHCIPVAQSRRSSHGPSKGASSCVYRCGPLSLFPVWRSRMAIYSAPTRSLAGSCPPTGQVLA